ncbi:MAG: membrane protein insertion efficiency factor YidD [Patescibacteria group bacterium]|nr:membrane protein insertion efficiency factor YidD [Patescibacteria group bacterium]
MKKVISKSYLFLTNLKTLFLKGNFGVLTICKHNPSCGEYFLETLDKEGFLKAFFKGAFRILTCW